MFFVLLLGYPAGLCQQPYFNVEASVTGDCVRCFCFGHSDECYSSNLQISQVFGLFLEIFNSAENPLFILSSCGYVEATKST